MLKFAYIINMPGQTPDTYSAVYENAESYNMVAGVDGVESAKDYVKALADDGYTLINLCGDFDDEITADIQAAAGADVKIRHADYLPAEMDKLAKLEDLPTYGIVIVMRGVETPHELELKCDDCDTTAIFVKDLEQAQAAAKKLTDSGIAFIELCSWFDKERTEAVIDAVGGAIPVGTCGEL